MSWTSCIEDAQERIDSAEYERKHAKADVKGKRPKSAESPVNKTVIVNDLTKPKDYLHVSLYGWSKRSVWTRRSGRARLEACPDCGNKMPSTSIATHRIRRHGIRSL